MNRGCRHAGVVFGMFFDLRGVIYGVFAYFSFNKDKNCSNCLSSFSICPSTIVAVVLFAKSILALPRPLPPLVAQRMIVFPEKSYVSKKVLTMVGAVYHHTG